MHNSTFVPNAQANKYDHCQLTSPKVVEENRDTQNLVSNCNDTISCNEKVEIIHSCDTKNKTDVNTQSQCIGTTQTSPVIQQSTTQTKMSASQSGEVKQTADIPFNHSEQSLTKDSSNQPTTINKVSNACWYFHAQVGDLEMPLLFDTGSTVSLISKEVYDNMTEEKPALTPVETTLFTANGSKLEILGQGIFKLKTEVKTYDWKFLVANIEGNMGIIGQDFIDSQGRSLKWKNLSWQTKAGFYSDVVEC